MGRMARTLPALWAGFLLCVATLATPAPFALLARADAGRVVARILFQEAWVSLVLALLVLVLARSHARRQFEAGTGTAFSAEMLLSLGAVFCTVAGYFGIQQLMPVARAGQGAFSFGQLHAASVGFFAIKAGLVLALTWRGSRNSP